MSAKKWETVGSMRQKDESKGGGYYLKVEKDIPAGSFIQLQRPADKINKLVELGHLTQEQAEERLAKIPDFVKFDLVLPPPKDDSTF
jgi:hypothetical protein